MRPEPPVTEIALARTRLARTPVATRVVASRAFYLRFVTSACQQAFSSVDLQRSALMACRRIFRAVEIRVQRLETLVLHLPLDVEFGGFVRRGI